MKHIKKFEDTENVDFLDDLIRENPLSKDNDFYMFIGKPDFIETEKDSYKKSIYIENMVRITPNSVGAMKGLEMRKMFQHDVQLYHIWLPKELEDDVSGKGSNRIEPWLVDLIDTHKRKGTDEHGKKVLKDVRQRNKDIEKYNL